MKEAQVLTKAPARVRPVAWLRSNSGRRFSDSDGNQAAENGDRTYDSQCGSEEHQEFAGEVGQSASSPSEYRPDRPESIIGSNRRCCEDRKQN